MTQKSNISAAVIIICTAFALNACITQKREKNTTGQITPASCKAQWKEFDSYRKVCKAPSMTFCATNFSMVRGMGQCRAPASSSECQSIGTALNKTMHWSGGKCQLLGGTTGGSQDNSIVIELSRPFKSRIPKASQYVMLGSATVKVGSSNDKYQVNMLKKSGVTCDLRHSSVSGTTFTIEAKGPVSTCAAKILVFNTKTGNYNVKEFEVKIY